MSPDLINLWARRPAAAIVWQTGCLAISLLTAGSMVGGIPGVVVHNETGYLVPVAQQSGCPFAPRCPETYVEDLAHAVNRLTADPEKRERFGGTGLARTVERFC